ncbi:MAG: tRNA pseudouridine(38-40) synthase TruA [Bacteroidales bacterium]|nr:tRNA pseudouridine(38-40) synthase TruA [Bacteroidales bacterium]
MAYFRYFIHLAYDGTNFHGWQRQSNSVTIQQVMESVMTLVMHFPITLTGAGRTDSGVHATSYFAHFDIQVKLGEEERKDLVFKLNRFLNHQIVVFSIFPVPEKAHARFSAVSRTYKYYITTRKNPFRYPFSFYLFGKIDMQLMNTGADLLTEYSDFTSFSKVDHDTRTNICKILYARWETVDDGLTFTITANRFLRNMVRAIVGTLLEVGKEKITMEEVRQIVESKNRCNAGESVPAKGLFLHSIQYPETVYSLEPIFFPG